MSPNAFTVRDAHDADRDAIAALIKSADLPADGVESARYAVAEHRGEVIGCAGLEIRGDAGLLRSVAVADSWRGRGVGEALVRTVLDYAALCSLDPVVLLTTTAPKWFPRFGFEVTDRGALPPAILESAEFRGACPASAIVMERWQGTGHRVQGTGE